MTFNLQYLATFPQDPNVARWDETKYMDWANMEGFYQQHLGSTLNIID